MKCRRNKSTFEVELQLYYPQCNKNTRCGTKPAYLPSITTCRQIPTSKIPINYLELYSGDALEVSIDGIRYENLDLKIS